MEHPSGGLYLPFIQSPTLGVGIGMISTSPFTEKSIFGGQRGTSIHIGKFTNQNRENIHQNEIITRHKDNPGEMERTFAAIVKNLTLEIRNKTIHGWIGFSNGTFVPILHSLSMIKNEASFVRTLYDYPMHRIRKIKDSYRNLLACYIRANKSPMKCDIFRAMVLLLGVFGYPYPGTGFRWTFKLQTGLDRVSNVSPDQRSDCASSSQAEQSELMGLTWIIQSDIDPTNVETTYIPEIAKEYCPDAEMQIPTISNPIIDELIFVAPVTLSCIKNTTQSSSIPIREAIHQLDTVGIEARRLDYMFPIATSHIALDGTITMI